MARKNVRAQARPKMDKRDVPELKGMLSANPNDTYAPKGKDEMLLTKLLRPDR